MTHEHRIAPSQHVPASFAVWEKSWHLNIILLTCKLSAANSITHMCIRKKENDVWIWNQSQVDAYSDSINKLNLMSSRAPPLWHFLLHFSIFLQLSFTRPPFLFPSPTTAAACPPSACPRSVFHSKSTSLPPSFSLSVQNNSHSRKRAINLLQWDQSARDCQGYSRLLSLLTPTQHWKTYRRRGWADREAGRVGTASQRNNLR